MYNEEQKESMLRLAATIDKFLSDKGVRPACPTIDAEKIIAEDVQHLTFYVNPHNLGWYVDRQFRRAHGETLLVDGSVIETSIREITLNLIGI
jgi:hypothetical protein